MPSSKLDILGCNISNCTLSHVQLYPTKIRIFFCGIGKSVVSGSVLAIYVTGMSASRFHHYDQYHCDSQQSHPLLQHLHHVDMEQQNHLPSRCRIKKLQQIIKCLKKLCGCQFKEKRGWILVIIMAITTNDAHTNQFWPGSYANYCTFKAPKTNISATRIMAWTYDLQRF